MRHIIIASFLTAAVIAVAGCGDETGRSRGEPAFQADLAPAPALPDSVTTADIISSSAAVENGSNSSGKFIRTADIKFKVDNVVQATYEIEDIVSRFGGYITYTHLASRINSTMTTSVSADSVLEATYYTVENSIRARIPNRKFDSVLKSLAGVIDFLDYRTITATDISLQYRSNQLTQERTAESSTRLKNAVDRKGTKLDGITEAEQAAEDRQTKADQAMLSNLALMDQVEFSPLELSIYQDETVLRELKANDLDIEEYRPGFGTELLEALETGWTVAGMIVVGVAQLWVLVLLAVVGVILYRRYRPRKG